MNKRIKKLWVDALRSGKFKQGKKRLRTGVKFCCLGVLCQLHAQETNHRWYAGRRGWQYLQVSDVLPNEVTKWAGLDDDSPSVDGSMLSHLNDHGVKFSTIADRIEKYL